MDVVYILGKGSLFLDFELRMSLRSIERNLQFSGSVYVVGEKPRFKTQNIVHIEARDISPIPDNNIQHKISIACKTPEISKDFIFINDDHYILSPYKTIPYYYHQTLETNRTDPYGQRKQNTVNYLRSIGKDVKNFDIHTPIIYNKDLFLAHVTDKWNNLEPKVVKSMYANSLDIQGEIMPDCKMHDFERRPIISSFPQMKAQFTRALQQEFPIKSRYEV